MQTSAISVAIKFKWWVCPFIHVLLFLAVCGFPIKVDRVGSFIAKRGTSYSAIFRSV